MRLKSWLAATAGVAAATPGLAQNPYPTNFEVEPAGHTAPAFAAPAAAAKPGFCLPGDPACKVGSYLDGPAAPGVPAPDALSAAAVSTRLDHTFWVHGEYLLWWSRTMGTPPLATRVPAAAVGAGPTTGTRLFPDQRRLDFDAQNGVRVSGGVRLTDCYTLEGSFFQLENKPETGRFRGTGLPGTDGLGRPYFAADGPPSVLYSALPGQYGGVVDVRATTELYGLEASVGFDTFRLFADHNRGLLGFRFVDLAERVTVTDASTFANGRVNTVQDVFAARNQFYGGQVGLHSRFFGGESWSFDVINKFAMGGVNQRVEIFGANANLDPSGTVDREAGGLLARPTNSGVFERDKFAITYDLTLTLGYQIAPRVRTTFGYSIFYLSNVVRPGTAIDPVVNDSTLRFVAEADRTPSAQVRPRFNFQSASTDYWAQGLNFGVQFGY